MSKKVSVDSDMLEAFEEYMLNLNPDGDAAIIHDPIEYSALSEEVGIEHVSLVAIIKQYRANNQPEKLVDILGQLTKLREACNEAIYLIVGTYPET